MNVSACLVTRGDVDMNPILDSLPAEWERIVWNNSGWLGTYAKKGSGAVVSATTAIPGDLAVYGRYAAIEHASHDVIYVQDDDCIVSDPQAIVNEWIAHCTWEAILDEDEQPLGYRSERQDGDHVVCNMPQEFRQFYTGDDALVGFGSCFYRDAPGWAFSRFRNWVFTEEEIELMRGPWFQRTCDIVFTGLTPTVLVDVQKYDRDFATALDRMYRQLKHVGERQRMRDLVAKVRDAG